MRHSDRYPWPLYRDWGTCSGKATYFGDGAR